MALSTVLRMTKASLSRLVPASVVAIIPALMCALLLSLGGASTANAATVTPLAAAGYAVLPTPQVVTLSGRDFTISNAWRVNVAPGGGKVAVPREVRQGVRVHVRRPPR